MNSPETLCAYALLLPRVWAVKDGIRHIDPPSEISLAAADALRFMADVTEANLHGET